MMKKELMSAVLVLAFLYLNVLITNAETRSFNSGFDNKNSRSENKEKSLVVLQGSVWTDETLTADNRYLLKGYVYVEEGATLTIEPGTVIMGDKETEGSLIIRRGGKIIAEGTAEKPIVFTSNQPAGNRNGGDWGGVVVCGKAPINLMSSGLVEGGPQAYYGGNDPEDNSGIIKYVRIEFAGIPLKPDQEINGLTLAGVGRGTVIDYVQVSYCGDDSFEIFGGTVNMKHLVSVAAKDDDFDTDNGWTGVAQFCYSIRDAQVSDESGSNCIESDNNYFGTAVEPLTSGVFCNVTGIGPYSPESKSCDEHYKNAVCLKNNTRIKVVNSVFSGYPFGVSVSGYETEQNAETGELIFANNIMAACKELSTTKEGSSFNSDGWIKKHKNNQMEYKGLKFYNGAWSIKNPTLLPKKSSPVYKSAYFSELSLQAKGIEKVEFVGAFGFVNWTEGWANFDPQQTEY